MTDKIQNRFIKNVEYLHKNHRTLYNKLITYEKLQAEGRVQEEYELTLEENGFDVFVKKRQSYLYDKNSTHYTNVMLESVNTLKNENVFKVYKIVLQENRPKGYQFLLDTYKEYHQENFNLKNVYKFIFFGTGLGLHITAIDKKIMAKQYLIIEDEIELFRLSLFTTPYYETAKSSTLHFAISSSTQEFKLIAQNFLDTEHYYNHYIKFFELMHHSEKKLEQFHTLTTVQSHLNFFYTSILEQYTKPLEYLKSGYNFLNLNAKELHTFMRDKPTILLAPGPSLQKSIPWLQEHQDKFLIVSLSATLTTLYKAKIKPDIIIHFDGFERSSVHFTKIPEYSFFQDSLLLASAKTPLNITTLFDKKRVFFFESGSNFKQGFGEMSAFCAGSSTYLLLIALKIQKLYLLGLDLAVDAQTLQTHSGEYHYKQTLEEKKSDTLDFRNSLIPTKGNFSPTVQTTPNFSISINAINEISLGLKTQSQVVYNLSEGAFLENTQAVKTENISLETFSKQELKNTLIETFLENSQDSLSLSENSFLTKVKQNNTTLLQIVENYIELENGNIQKQLINLENELMSKKENEAQVIFLILHNYIHFSYTFIFDILNTIEIESKEVSHSLYKELLRNIKQIIKEFDTKI